MPPNQERRHVFVESERSPLEPFQTLGPPFSDPGARGIGIEGPLVRNHGPPRAASQIRQGLLLLAPFSPPACPPSRMLVCLRGDHSSK